MRIGCGCVGLFVNSENSTLIIALFGSLFPASLFFWPDSFSRRIKLSWATTSCAKTKGGIRNCAFLTDRLELEPMLVHRCRTARRRRNGWSPRACSLLARQASLLAPRHIENVGNRTKFSQRPPRRVRQEKGYGSEGATNHASLSPCQQPLQSAVPCFALSFSPHRFRSEALLRRFGLTASK